MSPTSYLRVALLLAAFALAFTGTTDTAEAQFKVSPTDLGTLGGSGSFATAVNKHQPKDLRRSTWQRLVRRRAKAVRDYLVLKGVAERRLTIHGYGESWPRADNNTPQGRARNRRVELRLIEE